MGGLAVLAANGLWAGACLKEALAARVLRGRVEQTQARLLLDVVRRNRDTVFGRAHAFAEVRSVSDFQHMPSRRWRSVAWSQCGRPRFFFVNWIRCGAKITQPV